MCPRLEVPVTINSFENKFCKGSLGGGKGSLGGCKCSWLEEKTLKVKITLDKKASHGLSPN